MSFRSILNSRSLQGFYCSDSGYSENEKEAFSELLQNGSIIVFLYGDNELTPWKSGCPGGLYFCFGKEDRLQSEI